MILVLDLIAAGLVAQIFFDHWLAAALTQFRDSLVVWVLSLVPDRVQLSLLFTFLMVLLIASRIASRDRRRADRGMFVLGCAVVAGFASDKLKIVFGRPPPEAFFADGASGLHFFSGGNGFDSLPSSHAAMAAGIAGAISVIWPAHRRLFIGLAVVIAASRFITGAHYLSDAVLGFAVGLGIVMLIRILFGQLGIQIEVSSSTES